uniref:RNase H type-1 domain-containing protein n=1 Tax=Hordeum vulgare subsp. vulgare TaxID=112509 RepID=A0A8I6XXL7_HORVV
MGATAAVIRDRHGNFIAASCSFIQFASEASTVEASTVEAMAMKRALTLPADVGFKNIIAESDTTDVISACTSSMWWKEGAPIFADCMDLIAFIGNVKFCHCLREANVAADEIAKYSYENKFSCI